MADPILLTSGSSQTNSTSFTTASITFNAGDLILAYFYSDFVSSGTPAPPSSVTTPSGLTLTQQDFVAADTNFLSFTLYRGEATANGSGTITFNSPGGVSLDVGIWIVLKFTGHVTGANGANAFNTNKQLVGNKGAGSTDSATLSALANASSYALAAFGCEIGTGTTPSTSTPGNSFTEVADQGIGDTTGNFSESVTVIFKVNATNPAVTWTGSPSNRSSMAHEILMAVVPTISAQPSDQTVNNGATATFSVTATGGTTPYTYQWQDNSSGSFANIGGATSSSYSPTASYAAQGRQYQCVVTDSASQSVTSNAATLRVAFNLSGTGPRSVSQLGHPFGSGSVESYVRGSSSGSGSQSGTVAETATLTDSQTVQATFASSQAETASLTDSQTAQQTSAVSVSESATLTDSQTAAFAFAGSTAETATLTDSQTVQATFAGSQAESATLTDSQTVQATFASAQAETATLTDSQTAQQTSAVAVSESLTFTDSQTGVTGAVSGDDQEAISLSDSQTVQATFASTQAESATLTDSQTVQAAFSSAQAESATLTDSQTVQQTSAVSVSESMTLTDSQDGTQVAGGTSDDQESISLTDSASATAQFNSTQAETMSLSDSATASLISAVAVAESLTLTDSQTGASTQIYNVSVSESITFADITSVVDGYVWDTTQGKANHNKKPLGLFKPYNAKRIQDEDEMAVRLIMQWFDEGRFDG